MGVANSSFDTNQSISGIRYEINGKENIILGYYVSSQFKDYSDYQFKKIMEGSKLKHKIFDVKFESGYYLQNIVQEENNGNLLLTFSVVGTYSVTKNFPFPRTNLSICIVGVPFGLSSLQGHWMLPSSSNFSKLTPLNVGVRLAISSIISLACL